MWGKTTNLGAEGRQPGGSIRANPPAHPTGPGRRRLSLPARTFDIDRFSEQEKRILAVFFQNKGVRMSYEDVAHTLGKSSCTIKNQINQIRQKADLFDRTIGDQSRSFFKLKDDLRVEKYLKVGQPVECPLSMPVPDQSPVNPTKAVGDDPLMNSQM